MASRIKNLAKLGLLLGGPVVVLVGLFSCGVYCGHEHRETVLAFERDWLGMDVTVPGQPRPEPPKPEPTKTEPTKTEPTKVEPPKTEPTKVEPIKTEPTKVEPTKVEPTPTVEPVAPVLARVEDPLPLPFPEPAPLSGEDKLRLDERVRVTVKVLVDPGLATRRPDWLAYVQRHMAWASQVYEKELGLTLDLQGIVKLNETLRGVDGLKNYSRDGADLVLAFMNETPSPDRTKRYDNANLDRMVVYATQGSKAQHMRGLLFAIGVVLGGEVLGENSEDAIAGSWMGPNSLRADDSVPIKLDAANRLSMLKHKSFDFAPPPGGEPKPDPSPPPTVHDEPEAPADEREENP
ncbi:MAG: hypothetical protein JNL82_31515 [Myxococcales bacterium]|nr:hypothetical protein [Myxococcales bacterium]